MTDSNEAWCILGEAMRAVRQAAGRSLTGAAAEMGYSKSHLSQVERGRDRPSDELVRRYDRSYGGDGLLASLYLAARAPRLSRGAASSTIPTGLLGVPAVPPLHPGPAVGAGGDRSVFVADVTLPDGSVVGTGQRLSKTWRIRNGGDVPWVGRRLVRIGPCEGAWLLSSPPEVPVADTAPGEEVDITVPIRAPAGPGTSIALWKMVTPDDRFAFPSLRDSLYTLIIAVEGPQVSVAPDWLSSGQPAAPR